MFDFKNVIVLIFLMAEGSESKLPWFIRTCNRNGPDLSQCCENSVNHALPYILEGVNELGIPPLRNLRVPKIRGPSYFPYVFDFDGWILNLEGVVFNESLFDMPNLVEYGSLHFPELKLQGRYQLYGFVGNTPVRGSGFASVILHGVSLQAMWFFEMVQENGVEYMDVVSSPLVKHNLVKIEYQFENLLGGGELSGKEMNEFLNENWWLLQENFAPHVQKYILDLMFDVANRFLDSAAFDDIFPL